MNYIKQHWFGLLLGLFLLSCSLLFLTVLFSPRQDNQGRGFIPCTEQMAAKLYDCDGYKMCMLGAILNNSKCDAGVVFSGFKNWINGTQPRPWSNYFFEPELDEEETEAEVAEFYKDNPNLQQDMLLSEKQHKQLLEEYPNDLQNEINQSKEAEENVGE